MRQIDRRAQKEFGIPELVLMEHAGKAAAAAARRLRARAGKSVGEVVVLMHGAARVNLEILKRLRVPIRKAASRASWRSWSRGNRRVGVILDAMLGTGVTGRVREPIAAAIRWVNRQRCPVISVDVPSGLCSDTGRPCGSAVRATATITCGLPKIGLLRGQGRRLSGHVAVADISLPRVLLR